jgi:hypothetical protein
VAEDTSLEGTLVDIDFVSRVRRLKGVVERGRVTARGAIAVVRRPRQER